MNLHNICEGFVSGTHITLHVIFQGFVTMEITVGGGGGGDDVRITETGDTRITETGDRRVTE